MAKKVAKKAVKKAPAKKVAKKTTAKKVAKKAPAKKKVAKKAMSGCVLLEIAYSQTANLSPFI